MDIYHSWIYQYILNTRWMIWGIVGMVFIINILAPIHIWFVMNSKSMPFTKKKKKKEAPKKN